MVSDLPRNPKDFEESKPDKPAGGANFGTGERNEITDRVQTPDSHDEEEEVAYTRKPPKRVIKTQDDPKTS